MKENFDELEYEIQKKKRKSTKKSMFKKKKIT